MNKNTEELVLEHFRAIQTRLDQISNDVLDLRQRVSSLENTVNLMRKESAAVEEGTIRQQRAG